MNTPSPRRATRLIPLLPVFGTCAVSLVALRAELVQVAYLNDSAVHEEMVRVALSEIRSGHFPADSWFSYLNLGSPQFLHYQPLAAMLTALFAWVIGVANAFTLTTWLLVCCWPLCVYGAARIFGIRRGAAVAAAMLSPFISSATGVGYEQISYLWSGYGLWSQLFAMWTLPFAWACSWRAINERRFVVAAAVLIAATASLHFETGYLAFLAVFVFILVRPSDLLRRAWRGLLVMSGAFGLAAWAIVPLIAQGKWAAVNQFLQTGSEGVDANSYGAGRVLTWLADGDLFDWHHLLVITPLLALGFASCLIRWHRSNNTGPIDQDAGRALVVVFLASLVLFFGRSTLGVLLDVLPGAKDLFLRRFLVGVQLAGLFLAGIGAWWLATGIIAGAKRVELAVFTTERRRGQILGRLAVVGIAVAAFVPACSFVIGQADVNASLVAEQSKAGSSTANLNALLAIIARQGGGRTFAGDPSNWGSHFSVGTVPVFKYLASRDVDEVGFTLRTASLMSDPENEFDDTNPADYSLFAIRWLLLPSTMAAPVPAELLEIRGGYALWEIPSNGYVKVIDTRNSVTANSSDLGSFSASFLAGLPAINPIFPTVAYEGGRAPAGTLLNNTAPLHGPGKVLFDDANLADGTVVAKVSTMRDAVVLLSASFDPGWQALVDGRPVATEMIAPALIGVRVGPGMHTVRFFYRGFPDYALLFSLGALALVTLVVIERRHKRKAVNNSNK